MKILHLVMSKNFAGIEQHVNELAGHQAKNHDVHVIATDEILKKFSNNFQIHEIKNHGRRSYLHIFNLVKKIKKINPDIVHTHGTKTTQIINIVKIILDFKHVSTIHGVKKNKKSYEKSDLVIGVSLKTIKDIKIDSIIIQNWWSPSLDNNYEKSYEFALAVGRLEKVKGFDLLIRSWVNVNTKLLIIGSGNEYQKLKSLISELRLENKITLISEINQEDLTSYYQKASALVISSRHEGGPRVALEALYLKIPVISTNVGHMSEILPIEFMAEPDNINSLKELVEEYVDDFKMYDQSSIFEYISREFSLEAQGNKVIEAYNDLLIRS